MFKDKSQKSRVCGVDQKRSGVLVDTVLFGLLCAAVIGLAIPFGGVDLWARMGFALVVAGLLAVWSGAGILTGAALPVPLTKIFGPALLFAGVCVWIALQCAPAVPASWVHPVWQTVQVLPQGAAPGSVSLNREDTIQALISLLASGGVFWLALQLGRLPARAQGGLKVFAIASGLIALYGLWAFFGDTAKVLWFEKQHYKDAVTATFINRNAYATYAGLGLLCCVALLVQRTARAARQKGHGFLSVLEELVTGSAVYLVAAIVLATALLLTQSRAGNVSFALGLGAMIAAMARARFLKWRQVFGALFVLAPVVGGLLALSGQGLGTRLASLLAFSLGGRQDLYRVTFEAIKDRPFLGSGYGTYREAIYPWLSEELLTSRSWFDAHNTWAEKTLELGLPAAFALFAALILLARTCYKGLARNRHPAPAIAPAIAIGACVMVGAHALLDFSVEVPAVGAAWIFLLGLGAAQSVSGQEGAQR